jgi:hypothetical protein
MKLRNAFIAATWFLVSACTPPLVHPAGGPFCFVAYAGYDLIEPRYIALSRDEAKAMEREGRSFLAAYFDERGRMTSLRSCYKGKCEPQNGIASDNSPSVRADLGPEQCAVSPPQHAVSMRAYHP